MGTELKRIEAGHYEVYDDMANLIAHIQHHSVSDSDWVIYGPNESYVNAFASLKEARLWLEGFVVGKLAGQMSS